MRFQDFMTGIVDGIKTMIAPLLILVFAWALSGVCREMLGTGQFVSQFVSAIQLPMEFLQVQYAEKLRIHLEKKFNEIQPRSILERNDILTNIVGASIGRSCIYDLEYEDTNINQAVCLIRLTNKELNNYVLSYLNSPFCYKNLLINSVETARPNISLNTIGNLLVSLPPINEQKEIVLKLNNIIDKLETAE